MHFQSARAVLAMAAALWPTVAAAQPTSSFAELRARVNSGDTVIVTGGPQGWVTKGVIRSLTGDTLVLDAKGSRMSFAESEVQEIRRPSHRGRNAALGAGIGFLVGCIGAGAATRQDNYAYLDFWQYFGFWLMPAMGASVGAATGGSKTVFLPTGRLGRGTSISPWLAPNGAGLALAIRY